MGSTLGFVKMQCPQLTDAQTQGRCIACRKLLFGVGPNCLFDGHSGNMLLSRKPKTHLFEELREMLFLTNIAPL